MKDSTNQEFDIKAWLRLVRWPNLLIVALTQFVAWWCVIHPLSGQVVLTAQNFSLLCASTVLIAAGGYIINDYFDVRIDVINKPDKVILEKEIPRKLAIVVHSVFNVIALLLAALVALPAKHPEWLLLQLTCTGLLWRYSTTWKRQFMIGNVVVALMTALTIGALMLYEPGLWRSWDSETGMAPEFARWLLGIFMCFAFVLTWMREVIKDMEDFKGDDAEGCMTMPIRWGLLKSSRFVQAIGLLAFLVLIAASVVLFIAGLMPAAFYLIIFVATPLLLLIFQLPLASTQSHYHQASTRVKLIMVAGVAALMVFYFSINVR